MTADVVVDIGNSRIKWGRVANGRVMEAAAFGHDEPAAWQHQADQWELHRASRWVLAGVVPAVIDQFSHWLTARGMKTHVLTNHLFRHANNLGFTTAVEEPDRIGIDRLLTAFAGWRRVGGKTPVAILNVGTALTLDFVEQDGVHRGGVILPGPRLMARSLHQHTARLPLIDIKPVVPTKLWGENTEQAIALGIAHTVLGMADRMVRNWVETRPTPTTVFVTGGDAGFFEGFKFTTNVVGPQTDPQLTLDGIRLAAEEFL